MHATPLPRLFWYTLNTGNAIGEKNESKPWNCWALAISVVEGMGGLGVERSLDKLMDSEACLASHSKAETKAWTKKKFVS